MIRDLFTVSLVSLAFLGSASQQDNDSIGLQLIAATGEASRTLSRFLDQYACLKAGVSRIESDGEYRGGREDPGAFA